MLAPMLSRAVTCLLLCLSLGLSGLGCSLGQKAQDAYEQAGRASQELREALGVEAAISVEVRVKDDMQVVKANVRLPSVPQGMDMEQVRRQVNIIVRKHVKGVSDVTLTF